MKYFINIFIALFFLVNSAHAAIYLDNNTVDCFNGETTYDPATKSCGAGSDTVYTTLANALAGVSAGTEGSPTVVNVRAGTDYSIATTTFSKAWLTFQKYSGDGSQPVFTGSATEWYGKFQIEANGITLDNLEITGKSNAGGVIQAGDGSRVTSTTDLTVKNCTIHNVYGEAVMLWDSDDAIIQDNTIYRTQEGNISPYSNEWGGALYAVGCNGVLVDGNTIYNGGGEGMNFNRDCYNFTITDNIVYDHKAPAIFVNGVENCSVHGNLVYHTGASTYLANSYGIIIGAEDWGFPGVYLSSTNVDVYNNYIAGFYIPLGIAEIGSSQQVTNTRFYNNTVIEPFYGGYGHALYIETESGAVGTGVIVRNNIFWQTQSLLDISVLPSSGITIDYNLWSKAPTSPAQGTNDPRYPTYGSLTISDYLSKGSGWTSITPGALAISDFDLLSSGYYAIDLGLIDAYVTGWSLPYTGTSIDIGADEYSAAGAPTVLSATIGSTGQNISIVFSESVVMTDYDTGEFDLDCSVTGNGINLSSPTGSDSTWSFTIASTIQYNDVCNLDFTGDANSIEDTGGTDLAAFSDQAVVNNSEAGNEPPVYPGSVEGLAVSKVETLTSFIIEGVSSSGTPATSVEQTSTVTEIDTATAEDNQALTVPADAEIMVLAVSGTITGIIPADTFYLGASQLTRVVQISGLVYNEDVALFYIVNPTSATLYWNFGGAIGKGMAISIAYYKGINTSDPIRDSFAQTTGGADITGMSAFTGDMMVGAVFQFGLSPTVTDSSQTELANRLYNSAYGAMASKASVGDFYWTGDVYGYAVALVLKHQ